MSLEASVNVKIGEKTYQIKFPTVGQVMDIESKKVLLSGDTYREQVRTGTKASTFNLDLIDTVSHFMVLIPELRLDLDEKSLLSMSALKSTALIKAYLRDFRPWYNEFLKQLYSDIGEDSETSETETENS